MARQRDNGDPHTEGSDVSRPGRATSVPPPLPRTLPPARTSGARHAPPQAAPSPQTGRRLSRSRGWRVFNACVVRPTAFCGWSLLFITPLLALAIGLFYLRLMYSPISVDFLAEPIERALNAELSDLRVDIDGAVLHRSASGGIELRMRKLGLQDRSGARMGEAAWASVEVNLRGLLNGRLAPSRIVLIEPRILLEKKPDGRIAVSMQGDESSTRSAPAVSGPSPSQSGSGGASPSAPDQAAASDNPSPPAFDIGRMISEALDQMRPDGSGASALQAIGLRDASLTLDSEGRQTTWRVLELDVDLKQKQKRRIVSGRGRLATTGEPWSLSFRAEASQKAGTLTLTADIADATPGALVRDIPGLRVLERLDVPVTARSTFDFTPTGDLLGSTVAVDIGRGWLALTETETVPVGAGRIELRYSGETSRLDVLPSVLELAGRQVTLAGSAEPRDMSRPSSAWRFEIASVRPAAGNAEARPLIDSLSVRGGVMGPGGAATIEALNLKAGAVELTATGNIGGDGTGSSLELSGQIAPIQVSALGAAWPEAIAPEQRALVLQRLLKGNVVGRNFRLSTSSGNGGTPPKLQLAMTVEAYDVEMQLSEKLPPLELPRMLLRIDGGSLEATAPDAQMSFPGSKKISGKGVRLTAVSVDGSTPMAELVLRASAPLPAVVDLMEREPHALKDVGKIPPGLDGKVETNLRMTFPLSPATRAADVRYEANSRISDGRWRDAIGQLDVSGASIAIESNERTAEAKGELLLAGVNVKVAGQWLADPPEGRQPPIRFTTKLDRADRTQLGLDMEHMISGEVPVEVTIQSGGTEPAKINFGADLTNAEITISDVFWTKPSGQPARMQFDVIRGPAKALELQSFKLVGHNIAIDGTVSIGPDGKPKEYHFPEFAL
ncbi:MAG TPA: hypothetical protein VFV47_03985, partial [Hyphomicrobiaceae bacterium]|nr:hypothetical protein [Hyphomicrobiaceae bacterium]